MYVTSYLSNRLTNNPSTNPRSDVLTAVTMKSTVFWDVTLCKLADRYQRFEGICCIDLQGRKWRQQVSLKLRCLSTRLLGTTSQTTVICRSVCLSIYLSVCLSIYLSSICLSIYFFLVIILFNNKIF
jgi:hypothetical protein